jgi:hypothetical protein
MQVNINASKGKPKSNVSYNCYKRRSLGAFLGGSRLRGAGIVANLSPYYSTSPLVFWRSSTGYQSEE